MPGLHWIQGGVGKSSLMNRYVNNTFDSQASYLWFDFLKEGKERKKILFALALLPTPSFPAHAESQMPHCWSVRTLFAREIGRMIGSDTAVLFVVACYHCQQGNASSTRAKKTLLSLFFFFLLFLLFREQGGVFARKRWICYICINSAALLFKAAASSSWPLRMC